MAQISAPPRPRREYPFVDSQTGLLTDFGYSLLDQLWRQVAAGFVIVPCTIVGTNSLVLTPTLHEEGGRAYADGMIFSGKATASSTASVTAAVGKLTALKVYISGGASQAGNGDILINRLYLFAYASWLDSNAGGLVLK